MKTSYQKVEGILYSHYKRKSRKIRIEQSIARAIKRKEKIVSDIKNTNIVFCSDLQAMQYDKDKIVTNYNIDSTMEQDIEIGIQKLNDEYKKTLKKILKLKRDLIIIQEQLDNIEILLEDLKEEEKQILDLKYGDKKTYREMEEYLCMNYSTISRNHKEIIGVLEDRLIGDRRLQLNKIRR